MEHKPFDKPVHFTSINCENGQFVLKVGDTKYEGNYHDLEKARLLLSQDNKKKVIAMLSGSMKKIEVPEQLTEKELQTRNTGLQKVKDKIAELESNKTEEN